MTFFVCEAIMTPLERLEEMLAEKGYTIYQPIVLPKGRWRREDVYRWQAYAYDAAGNKVTIDSWDTVTECVRQGFTIGQEQESGPGWQLLASANPTPK